MAKHRERRSHSAHQHHLQSKEGRDPRVSTFLVQRKLILKHLSRSAAPGKNPRVRKSTVQVNQRLLSRQRQLQPRRRKRRRPLHPTPSNRRRFVLGRRPPEVRLQLQRLQPHRPVWHLVAAARLSHEGRVSPLYLNSRLLHRTTLPSPQRRALEPIRLHPVS